MCPLLLPSRIDFFAAQSQFLVMSFTSRTDVAESAKAALAVLLPGYERDASDPIMQAALECMRLTYVAVDPIGTTLWAFE